jgi:hypothetical protein
MKYGQPATGRKRGWILEPTVSTGSDWEGLLRTASSARAIGHFNAVIFVPQMSQIVEGGPEDRRRYLNLALAQAIPAYMRLLSEYNQALNQRNALLKSLSERGGNSDQLSVWDERWPGWGRSSSCGAFMPCRRSSASRPASSTS